MNERITVNNENRDNTLLETLQKLSSLTESRDDAELTDLMEKLKFGIFTALKAKGIITEGLTYEIWSEQFFPNSTGYNPIGEIPIIALARDNDLITEQDTSVFLKAKLGELIATATTFRFSENKATIQKARECVRKDIFTLSEFKEISTALLSPMYDNI